MTTFTLTLPPTDAPEALCAEFVRWLREQAKRELGECERARTQQAARVARARAYTYNNAADFWDRVELRVETPAAQPD